MPAEGAADRRGDAALRRGEGGLGEFRDGQAGAVEAAEFQCLAAGGLGLGGDGGEIGPGGPGGGDLLRLGLVLHQHLGEGPLLRRLELVVPGLIGGGELGVGDLDLLG